MTPAWFFMDQEAFDSVLVKGFLMENLRKQILKRFMLRLGEKYTK